MYNIIHIPLVRSPDSDQAHYEGNMNNVIYLEEKIQGLFLK
jgi:hypothetical protein